MTKVKFSKGTFLLIFGFFFFIVSPAQTRHIDSLRVVLKNTKNPLTQSKTSIEISESFYRTLKYPDSSYFFAGNAYQIALDNNFKLQEGLSLALLGKTLCQIYEYDEALTNLQKARNIFSQLKDSKNLSIINSNIGGVYLEKSKFDIARAYFKEAIEISKKEKDTFRIIANYMNLGENEGKLNHLDASMKYLERAHDLMNEIDIDFAEGHIYYGRTLLAMGQSSLSIKEGIEALDIAQKESNIRNIVDASELLYRGYEAQMDYENAFTYHNRYVIYKDSLNAARERNTLEKSKLKFNLKRKEKELTFITQRAKYRYLIAGLGIIGLLMIVFLIKKQKKISALTRNIKEVQKSLIQNEIDKRKKGVNKGGLISNFELTRFQDRQIDNKN